MNKFGWTSSLLIGYMLLAFTWWAVLLWRSEDRQFELETKVLQLESATHAANYTEHPAYAALLKKHERRQWMIIGEGVFFSGCLIFGLLMIRRSAQREVALARQRRNFLLSITHELKSPIAAIRLVLETFAKRALTKEQAQPLIAGGLQDATRLQNLVQDLLLAARLEDSWRPLPEPIRLKKLVDDCIAALKLRFQHSNVENNIPDDLPMLQADKSGITSVLMNLLENAIKYSPKGATVKVEAGLHKGKTRIRVIDQGQGIPPEERHSVFEKFYRLGNEETRKATGTGLGLYIVRQVIHAHKGAIEIGDNQPNGAVFTIDL